MFCPIFSLTHHFLSYFLSSATPPENKKWRKPFGFLLHPTPPPPPFRNSWTLARRLQGGFGDMFPKKIWKEIAKCYVFWYLFWLNIWCNVECYLLIILSSLFSEHVNLHTKNNTPAMGVRETCFLWTFWKIGVIWCIDAYFKDICLNPFSFLFIDKYW